ncbi:homoserine dehydrogenase [Oscillibacter valericigenes]|uniref:Homoserine dehydrogenase n=1 Tax=Oscillibacter valericigenes TaxID=351091 RepID=A0ABS2FQZ9_9FIRM|nr:homoserine dehydrogenase [Oscillibacter valericigenes]MBM6850022.1 homoserine dehydrogenase [Oscillibacter valericigenes]MBM6909551.1 homoserine dehydrogenase [Oscillibacter valericigenes]
MIQIAIMGLGTVGTGVAKVVAENARQIERKLGEPLQVKTILVRHFKDGPYRQLMTDDFTRIEEDDAIRVVVETIGGVEAAYEYTKRALNAGKHVVTANKQLVAEKGCELLALAKKRGVNYLFEASVGGGIPVLHPLTQCMAANRIDEVYGILNGTTNYILTRMVRAGATFADALREAQEKGYAEADPTADVEGIDAGRKICILADLAFGRQVDPAAVPMEGISRLSLDDVRIAQRAGYRIKLLGRALRLGSGRTAYVAPHLVPEDHPLANVEDVFNAVVVKGNATGEVMFYGRGAGEMPTASACVADVMEALQASPRREEIGWEADPEGFVAPQTVPLRHYFRIRGSLADAVGAFGQVEVLSEDSGMTAFLTEPVSGGEAAEKAAALAVLARLPVLG